MVKTLKELFIIIMINKSNMMPGKFTNKTKLKTKSNTELTKKVDKIQKVQNRRKPEPKYHDKVIAAFNNYNVGSIDPLSNVPQGATDITRNGDMIQPTSIEFKSLSRVGWGGAVRFIAFQWHSRFTIDAPTVAKILDSSTAATTNAVNAPYYHDGRSQWTKLFDVTKIVYAGSTGVVSLNKIKKVSRPIRYYNGSTTDMTNGVYLLAIDENALAGASTLDYVARLNYTDI